MKRCIVHIGMQKSGSASIQRSLKGYADGSFYYARLGSPNHGRAMLGLFAPEKLRNGRRFARSPETADPEYAARAARRLEESIAAAENRTLLISGEAINRMPADGLVRMRDYLRDRFDEIDVMGYVRPPGALMSSWFQQRVISGALGRRFRIEREYHCYREIFGAFDDIFGRDHVHLRKFDPSAFPGGCVVRDFCTRVGLDLPASRFIRRNDSLTGNAVALVYAHRLLGPRFGHAVLLPDEVRDLGNCLKALGGGKFRFSPEIVAPVLAAQRADIEWMEERLGESLREELGEHQPGDVRGESDLLNLASSRVTELLALTGAALPAGGHGTPLEQVVCLVQALREQNTARTAQREPA